MKKQLSLALIPSVIALAICVGAILVEYQRTMVLAAITGVGTLAAVVIIRRLGLGRWGQLGVVTTAVLAFVGFVLTTPDHSNGEPTAAFASDRHQAIAQRMLPDVPRAGTGGGTLAALIPIYRDATGIDDKIALPATTIISIEMGESMLWIIAAMIVFWILLLLVGSLRRGRDSFYPSAGAACLIAIAILAFDNSGPLDPAISIITGTAFGLAVSQSKSRVNPILKA